MKNPPQDALDIINNYFPLSRQSQGQFDEMLKLGEIEKGKVFVEKDKPNQSEYLVLEGVCRSFVLNPDGEEITLSFFTAGTAVSPNISRTKDHISNLNIQALTKVKIATFSSERLTELMIANREIREWGNVVLQWELMQKAEKELTQASMTAKERLILFRERYGDLENLVPHPCIAAYLGITPISLSRIRKELVGK